MATTAFRILFPPIGTHPLSASVPDRPGQSVPDKSGKSKPGRETALSAAGGERLRVFVVDDETLIADSVAEILNRNGYDATALYSGMEAIRQIEEQCPDILVTDVIMPDFNGIRLAMAIRARCPQTRIVLFSGNAATSSLLDHAVTDGFFFELLTKPVHPAQLLKALKS